MGDIINWVRSKREPEYAHTHGDRLYHVESGCEYGFKDKDGNMWYRIQTSYWFGDWIEENSEENVQWRRYGGRHRAIYIVREDLLMFIKMKWL